MINSYNDLLSLEDVWNNVLQHCEHSVFSNFEWISTWWKYYGIDRKLMILLAEDKGEVIGIAPLMLSVYSMYGSRKGKIEFIAKSNSDYSDFMITNKSEECLDLFFKYLKSIPDNWDFARLENIPEESKNLAYFKEASNHVAPLCKCFYLPLPESFQDFLSNIGSNMRHNIKKNGKLLNEKYAVDYVDCSGVDSYSFGADWLFKLHQKRWSSKGYSGAFGDPITRNFHLEVMDKFSKKGMLKLFLMKLSGIPVAAAYGFTDYKKFYFYLQGIDPDQTFSKFGLGNQITAYTVDKCIADDLKEFDFLRGDEEYKDRWGTSIRWNYEIIVTRDLLNSVEHSVFNKLKLIDKSLGSVFKR
jgi:CelD/BcsL family acetyltransferase involved in cellulose biosynthesis